MLAPKKLEEFVQIEIEPEVILYIKNKRIGSIQVGDENNIWIVNSETGEKLKEVILYKRLFDDNGDLLDEPLFDKNVYYIEENGKQRELCWGGRQFD